MQTRLWRRQDPKAFQATRAIECRTEPQDPRSAENAEPAMYTGKPVDVRDDKWFHRVSQIFAACQGTQKA